MSTRSCAACAREANFRRTCFRRVSQSTAACHRSCAPTVTAPRPVSSTTHGMPNRDTSGGCGEQGTLPDLGDSQPLLRASLGESWLQLCRMVARTLGTVPATRLPRTTTVYRTAEMRRGAAAPAPAPSRRQAPPCPRRTSTCSAEPGGGSAPMRPARRRGWPRPKRGSRDV